jgi:hypothetical protein
MRNMSGEREKGTIEMSIPPSKSLVTLRRTGAFWVLLMILGMVVPPLLSEVFSGRFHPVVLGLGSFIALIGLLDYLTAAGDAAQPIEQRHRAGDEHRVDCPSV